jgi:hypothetical protein
MGEVKVYFDNNGSSPYRVGKNERKLLCVRYQAACRPRF